MESRGMDAVAGKVSGRKMVLKRRGGAPGIAIIVGAAPSRPKMEDKDEAETLVCPKCGAELANTPENKEYAAKRKMGMEDEAEDEMESEDESDDEEYA